MKLSLAEHIRTIPVLRPLLFFLSGILYGEGTANRGIYLFFGMLIFLLFLLIWIITKDMRLRKGVSGFIFLVFFAVSGYSFTRINREYPALEYLEGEFITEALDFPVEKEKSWFVPLRLLYLEDTVISSEHIIKANVYFESAGFDNRIVQPGTIIFLNSKLKKVSNNGNPDEFDYAGYLMNKGVFYTAYCKAADYQTSSFQNKRLIYEALKIRKKLENHIWECSDNIHQNVKSVLIAISLGNKSHLSAETKDEYARAGAIHVMAVSGLHVGLLWMFITYITLIAGKSNLARINRFLIQVTVIWGYAILTGLSPSVTRAGLMFSMVGISQLILRNSSVFNSLVVSAFIQLIIDPGVLHNLGFQFSYSAVFSILFCQKSIRSLFPWKNRLLSYFADLISVSISAQVLTFPLTLYYFNQFPLYFLLTNLIIIPLVTAIMVLFILSVFFMFYGELYQILMLLDLKLSSIMSFIVDKISKLPGAVLERIVINEIQLLILIIIPLFILLFIYKRNLSSLKASVLLLSLFILIGVFSITENKSNAIVIFNIPGHTVIDIYNGEKHLILKDYELNYKLIDYSCNNYWLEKRLGLPEMVDIENLDSTYNYFSGVRLPGVNNFLFHIGGKRICFLNDYKWMNSCQSQNEIIVDLVILNSPAFWDLNMRMAGIKPKEIVLTSIIPEYSIKQLKTEFNVNHYYVRDSGACIFTF